MTNKHLDLIQDPAVFIEAGQSPSLEEANQLNYEVELKAS